MKPYPKYKPSGVEWLGDIPEHWEIPKFTREVFFQEGPGIMASDFMEHGVPLVRISGVKGSIATLDGCNFLKEEKVLKTWNHFRLEKNDLLISGSASTDLVSEVGEETIGAIPYTGIIRLKPKSNNLQRQFLKQFLTSTVYQFQISMLKAGSIIQHYGPTHLRQFFLILPPLSEQESIATFLDDKIKQIDTLIEKKQKLIELLKEERQAVINEAVTKGINPKAKMKPSGVEWLGDIPEHWEVKKLKSLTSKIGSGVTPTGGATVYKNLGVAFIRSQNIYNEGFEDSDIVYISEKIHRDMKGSQVKEGDVLLNITGASIGRCYFYSGQYGEANVNQHVCIIRPINRIQTEYLYYLLSSNIGQLQIDLLQSGANREGLNFEQLKGFYIPLPSIKDQAILLEFLKSKTLKFTSTIEAASKEIELLKEYRTALITEVVTGKVSVL